MNNIIQVLGVSAAVLIALIVIILAAHGTVYGIAWVRGRAQRASRRLSALAHARRRLSAQARVLRAAEAWARAERALRNCQGYEQWRIGLFSEANHCLSLTSDVTGQELLDAVEAARKEGLDLTAITDLS